MEVLDRLVCDFAGDRFALQYTGVDVKMVEGIPSRKLVSLGCRAEEEAEEGEDSNGRQDKKDESAVGDTRLGRHLGGII